MAQTVEEAKKWGRIAVFESENGADDRKKTFGKVLFKNRCKSFPFRNFNANSDVFIQIPELPLNGSKRGFFSIPTGQCGDSVLRVKRAVKQHGNNRIPILNC